MKYANSYVATTPDGKNDSLSPLQFSNYIVEVSSSKVDSFKDRLLS